jgi:hypothetical protein
MTTNKIAKINRDRKYLMNLLRKLRIEIVALLQDRNADKERLDELFRRRKDYRNRLTKLTNKRRKK